MSQAQIKPLSLLIRETARQDRLRPGCAVQEEFPDRGRERRERHHPRHGAVVHGGGRVEEAPDQDEDSEIPPHRVDGRRMLMKWRRGKTIQNQILIIHFPFRIQNKIPPKNKNPVYFNS